MHSVHRQRRPSTTHHHCPCRSLIECPEICSEVGIIMSASAAEMHREMRYMVAGVQVMSDIAYENGRSTDRGFESVTQGMQALLDTFHDGRRRSERLQQAILQTQLSMLEALRAPGATAAAELLQQAIKAAQLKLWDEAVADYKRSIDLVRLNPIVHLGLGLALTGKSSECQDPAEVQHRAADAFQKAFRYAKVTDPPVAVAAVQYAVVTLTGLGCDDDANVLLRDAAEALPQSPEIAFSAALRFRAAGLLIRAVDLDPTLADDPSWQSLPFAAEAVTTLLRRQRAVIPPIEAAISASRQYGNVSQLDAAFHTPIAGATFLRRMRRLLVEAAAAVNQTSPEERERLAAAAMAEKSMDGVSGKLNNGGELPGSENWRIAGGILAVLGLCSLGAAVFDGDADLMVGAGIFLIPGVLVLAVPTIWQKMRQADNDELRKQIRSIQEEREGELAIAERLKAERGAVAAQVAAATAQLDERLSRSLEAYPLHLNEATATIPTDSRPSASRLVSG